MPYELGHQTNRRVVGQAGLVVMHWDFRLMVNGFVFKAKCSKQDIPDGESHATPTANDATPTGYLQLTTWICCSWSGSEDLVEHACRTDDGSQRTVLRLQTLMAAYQHLLRPLPAATVWYDTLN